MKYLTYSLYIFLTLLISLQYSFANEKKCSQFLKTVWEGKKVGKGYQGPITIKFKNKCTKPQFGGKYFQIKYNWIGKSGKVVTPGKLKFQKNGTIEYLNGAGSNGVVTINNNKLIWKNIYTGNNYNVNVSKINK
mgnify:CR=1 FL=1